MSKPKNPYDEDDVERDVWNLGYDDGYAAGLLAGEARLARALRRWSKELLKTKSSFWVGVGDQVNQWLRTRQKRKP